MSSREQEREGFSLDVQEDALKRYAESHGGTIVKLFKLFKIAETASIATSEPTAVVSSSLIPPQPKMSAECFGSMPSRTSRWKAS